MSKFQRMLVKDEETTLVVCIACKPVIVATGRGKAISRLLLRRFMLLCSMRATRYDRCPRCAMPVALFLALIKSTRKLTHGLVD